MDTECLLDDLPRVMDDRNELQVRIKGICVVILTS